MTLLKFLGVDEGVDMPEWPATLLMNFQRYDLLAGVWSMKSCNYIHCIAIRLLL